MRSLLFHKCKKKILRNRYWDCYSIPIHMPHPVWSNPWLVLSKGHFLMKACLITLVPYQKTNDLKTLTWDWESWHNPAVSIENIAGNISTDAVNGLSNQIVGSHQNGGEKQNGCTGPVVELEKGRVNVRFVSLVTGLD